MNYFSPYVFTYIIFVLVNSRNIIFWINSCYLVNIILTYLNYLKISANIKTICDTTTILIRYSNNLCFIDDMEKN